MYPMFDEATIGEVDIQKAREGLGQLNELGVFVRCHTLWSVTLETVLRDYLGPNFLFVEGTVVKALIGAP